MTQGVGEQPRQEISLFNQIKQKGVGILWHNRKIKAILVLICANVINNIVSFSINIIIARRFGPEIFGVFSLAWSVMMAVHLIADLGLNLTIVRFFNLYRDDSKQQNVLLVSLLLLKLSVALIVIFVSLPLGGALSQLFTSSGSHSFLFSLAFASAGIFGLWVYFQNFLQAHKQFSKYAVFTVVYAVLRLTCFFAIYFWFTTSANLPLAFGSLYTGPLLIAVGIGVTPIAFYLLKMGVPRFAVMKGNILRVLKYGKWVAISGLCHNFIYRGVQFILATRTTQFELGIFSAGFVFTLAFSPINMAIRTVFFPYVTAYSHKDMSRHLVRIRKLFPYYVVFVVMSICALALIQIVLLGAQYAKALPVFLITSAALTIMIFLGLISMLVHTLMRPEIDAYANIGRLTISSVLVYILAPSMGAIGGALSYAIPLVLGEALMVLYVRKLVYEKK